MPKMTDKQLADLAKKNEWSGYSREDSVPLIRNLLSEIHRLKRKLERVGQLLAASKRIDKIPKT